MVSVGDMKELSLFSILLPSVLLRLRRFYFKFLADTKGVRDSQKRCVHFLEVHRRTGGVDRESQVGDRRSRSVGTRRTWCPPVTTISRAEVPKDAPGTRPDDLPLCTTSTLRVRGLWLEEAGVQSFGGCVGHMSSTSLLYGEKSSPKTSGVLRRQCARMECSKF